ncbi:MAG: hypothetical protein WA734_08930, partial [Candidatus Acidiferrales bacterium]
LQPLSKDEADRQRRLAETETEACTEKVAALPEDANVLVAYLKECTRLLNEEADVRHSVEGRLTNIVGLSSIAGSIVFGVIYTEATGNLHAQTTATQTLLALSALYLTLQICCAVFASIVGLKRRNYHTEMASDVLPSLGETHLAYLRRQITASAERLDDHRRQTTAKVSQMGVAHCAMENFVGGLILLALFGTCFALRAKKQDTDILNTLKHDRALYEFLRGPQGPKGDIGPEGPPGEVKEPSQEKHLGCVQQH